MIFDELCKLLPLLPQDGASIMPHNMAQIIKLDDDSFNPTHMCNTVEEWVHVNENFRLPFTVSVIEDRASCVSLTNLEAISVGIAAPKIVVEYIPPNSDLSALCSDISVSIPGMSEYGYLRAGIVRMHPLDTLNKYTISGELKFLYVFDTHDSSVQQAVQLDIEALPPELLELMTDSFLQNGTAAIEHIKHLHTPGRMMIETLPMNQSTEKSINGANDLPVYHVLTDEIIERLKAGRDIGGKGKPTKRRLRNVLTVKSVSETITTHISQFDGGSPDEDRIITINL